MNVSSLSSAHMKKPSLPGHHPDDSPSAPALAQRAADEEMPLKYLADTIATPFSPFLDAIARENSRTPAVSPDEGLEPRRPRPARPRARLQVRLMLRQRPLHPAQIPKPLPEDTPVWVPSLAKVFPGTARCAPRRPLTVARGCNCHVDAGGEPVGATRLCVAAPVLSNLRRLTFPPFSALSSFANSEMVRNVLIHDPKKVRCPAACFTVQCARWPLGLWACAPSSAPRPLPGSNVACS